MDIALFSNLSRSRVRGRHVPRRYSRDTLLYPPSTDVMPRILLRRVSREMDTTRTRSPGFAASPSDLHLDESRVILMRRPLCTVVILACYLCGYLEKWTRRLRCEVLEAPPTLNPEVSNTSCRHSQRCSLSHELPGLLAPCR